MWLLPARPREAVAAWAQRGRGVAPASPVQWVRRALAERISPELGRDAREDPLTGALNRRADRVATARALAERRKGTRVVRLLADLDNFKLLNDRRGHAVGDRALCVVRAALERATRGVDVVSLARPGGDEFTLTLRVAPAADPAAIRDRIEQTVNRALAQAGLHSVGRRRIGISIGVAEACGPTTLEALDAVARRHAVAQAGARRERATPRGRSCRAAGPWRFRPVIGRRSGTDRRQSSGRRLMRDRRREEVPVLLERRSGRERRSSFVRRSGAERRLVGP